MVGFLTGVVFGYQLNKNWTYGHQGPSTVFLSGKYFTVYLCSLALSLTVLAGLVRGMGIDPRVANLLTIGLTTMTNFCGTKFWVFREAT
jgi:putative flippase GtrA